MTKPSLLLPESSVYLINSIKAFLPSVLILSKLIKGVLIFQENKSTKTTQTMNQPGGFNMPSAPSAPGGPGFDPSSTSLPTSTVEISVRCTDLADKDLMSKSDPICVMFMQKQGKWFEIGRTEMIADTLNPSWEKKFVVDYSFEERQVVKFEIYDWDVDSKLLSDHDFLG